MGDEQLAKDLLSLVGEWEGLVRAGRERQPGHLNGVLSDLGPAPRPSEASACAHWVAALINPLPGLGLAHEVRPAVLRATSAREQLVAVTTTIRRSIEHLGDVIPL